MRLPVLLVLLAPLPAFAKLEVRNVQPAHGPLGPARTSDDVFPLDEYYVRYQVAGVKPDKDEYYVRYQVAGVKPDKDGKADLEVAVRLTNPDGKAVYEPKPAARKYDLSLGGDVVQTKGFVTFGEKAAPGEYKLTVTVRDRTANESASFERKLTCKPAAYQIVAPRFFHDEEGKDPAGTTVLAGDTLHYRLAVVGYDKAQKRVSLVMRAQVLDADGKDVGAKPTEVKATVTDPAEVAKSRRATFREKLTLNRPGEFKLRVTVEDVLGKKTATFEAPLKVLAP